MDIISFYRVERQLFGRHVPVLPKVIQLLIFLIFNSKITANSKTEKGSYCVCKGISTALIPGIKTGENCVLGLRLSTVRRFPYKEVPCLKNNVWMGPNVIIAGPVVMEDDAVATGNSLVNRSVPRGAIVAGCPVKIVGWRKNLDYTIETNPKYKDGRMPSLAKWMTPMNDITDAFHKLKIYCETKHFKGWNPYDGLNSRIFQAVPLLKKSVLCRLMVVQGFKHCPFNMRQMAFVPKEYGAEGIGLFLPRYCNLYKVVENHPQLSERMGTLEMIKTRVEELTELLISLQSRDYSGTCWEYNFSWQARRLSLFPEFMPTVVATNFCATALIQAYEMTRNKYYSGIALNVANFVIKDLCRTPYSGGFPSSYSPLEGNDTVFNASLPGSRLLGYCFYYTQQEEYRRLTELSIKACCSGQREDGAWVCGILPVQNWVDNFHTGYNLNTLIACQKLTEDYAFNGYIERGFDYYANHFFEADGTPKYYDNRTYPIDIHCPRQLLVTLTRLYKMKKYEELAKKVLRWTIRSMQDKKGYFYYQLEPGIGSKISYMQWSSAFMFNAISHYLLAV